MAEVEGRGSERGMKMRRKSKSSPGGPPKGGPPNVEKAEAAPGELPAATGGAPVLPRGLTQEQSGGKPPHSKTEGLADQSRLAPGALARECRSDRESVKRWLTDAGHDALNLDPALHDVYVAIIRQHQKESTAPGMPGAKAGRTKDGLTWLEAVQKQDALRKERENKIADKVLKEEWVSASAHHQILANLTAKLETAPDKIKTELGLTIGQRDRIQKILDDLRFDAADEVRRAFTAAKKKVMEAKGN